MSATTKNYVSALHLSCATSGEVLREYQQLSRPLGAFNASGHWTVSPSTPLCQVLTEMDRRDSDVAVVVDETGGPLGIFTQRDLLNRIVIPRLDLDLPISHVMTRNPVTLPSSALGYEAIVAMAKGGFHHIILMSDGRVTGTVSEYDLFTMQQISIGQLAARINAAESQETIHACAEEIRNLVEYMFVQGVAADQITQIISTFNDQLVKRIIDLETMGEDLGDVRVCWIIMGSEGRHEQTVSTDQDNAAIFDHPGHVSPDEARKLILPIAKRVNQALHAIGIDLCKGNVMAGNPDCCLSLSEWKKKFHAWILEPTPESLLNVTIYFDFRALHGHTDLAHDLRTWLTDAAVDQKRFLHQITEVALEKSPPFTFFNTIIQENHPEVPHSIDIKQSGINVFVDAARIYALALGIPTTRTHERLTLAAGKRSWPENSVIAWTEAFNFLQGVRIRHHLQSKDHKAQNRLDLCKLNDLEQKVCAEAFRQAGKLQKRLRDDFRNNLLHSTFSGA